MAKLTSEEYAKILSEMVAAETVSGSGDLTKYRKFHGLLRSLFPRLFASAETEDFDGSLLIRIKGTNPEKQPILLMSHFDVVEAGGNWTYPPFSGTVADGKVWGRGTLDTKGSLMAILEATEELLTDGFLPEGDIYIESACAEETDGHGAETIARELEKRGIRFRFSIDEGGMILYDPLGGADGTYAMVGLGEKGCTDLKITAKTGGGHASMPGKNTALVRLGKFMAAYDKKNIFKTEIPETVHEMFSRLSLSMHGGTKYLLGHSRFFAPLLRILLPMISKTAASMMRTTLAFTMAKGSDGRNVLPEEAWVVGNMRFSHHEGRDASVAKVRKLASEFGLTVEILDPGFSSALSSPHTEEFLLLERAVSAVFPGVYTAPYIMTGASDSRYFTHICDNCFRFAPFTISDSQLNSIHGIDENIDVSSLAPAVDFFQYIIKGA